MQALRPRGLVRWNKVEDTGGGKMHHRLRYSDQPTGVNLARKATSKRKMAIRKVVSEGATSRSGDDLAKPRLEKRIISGLVDRLI